MQFIELTQGGITVVDDSWYEILNILNWRAIKTRCYYPSAGTFSGEKVELMHRAILGALPGEEVDHIDGNPLNNQCSNLRICTKLENLSNMRARKKIGTKSFSMYKGVHRAKKRWAAYITVNRKGIHLGTFDTEDQAAEAYNKAALKAFGRFARLNIIRKSVPQEKYFEF